MMNSIYLDHAATTPLHPQVLEKMIPYLSKPFGNPSSLHAYGREARAALNEARDRIAENLHCSPRELIFTSGGTESDNTALFGAVSFQSEPRDHIITSEIEHHAVLHACEQLEMLGFPVTYLPVDHTGRIHVEDLQEAIRPETKLISIMYGNNEVGTLQPIEEIGTIARSKGILFHVDGVQAVGHVPLNLSLLPVDLMSFSAHKVNGPKGVGALYLSRKARIHPYLFGGAQERKRRAGTENTVGIIGFAEAVQLAIKNFADKQQKTNQFRLLMIETLQAMLGEDGFVINGHPEQRLPHILNISFPGISSETLLMNLDLVGIAASTGSACTSGSLEVSHVLKAMHLPEEITQSAIRFSFGMDHTEKEIIMTAQKIATIVNTIRNK